jgi:hypothetical protein
MEDSHPAAHPRRASTETVSALPLELSGLKPPMGHDRGLRTGARGDLKIAPTAPRLYPRIHYFTAGELPHRLPTWFEAPPEAMPPLSTVC